MPFSGTDLQNLVILDLPEKKGKGGNGHCWQIPTENV